MSPAARPASKLLRPLSPCDSAKVCVFVTITSNRPSLSSTTRAARLHRAAPSTHSWFRRAARSLSADSQRATAVSVHPYLTTGSADSVIEGDQGAVVAAVDGMGDETVMDGSGDQRGVPFVRGRFSVPFLRPRRATDTTRDRSPRIFREWRT